MYDDTTNKKKSRQESDVCADVKQTKNLICLSGEWFGGTSTAEHYL